MDKFIEFMDFYKKLWDNPNFRYIVCILVVLGIVYDKFLYKNARNWNFKGPIEKVTYDVKGFPSITVKGKEYNLWYVYWHFDVKLHKGDTVIKNKGDRRIKVIFRNRKDTVFFSDREF